MNLGVSTNGLSRYNECRTEYNKFTGKFRSYIPGRAFIDEMEAFKKYNIGNGQRESNGLKSVISDKSVLKDAAFSYRDYGPMIDQVIKEKRFEEFLQYCKNDVIALRVIDKELGLFNFFETTRVLAGNKMIDGLHNSTILETYVMHEGIRPMPRKTYGGPKEKFKGALVVAPSTGIHEWVATVDLNALYPHIIVGFDVSPDIDGIIAKTTKKLMDLRDIYREQKKQGLLGAAARDSSAKSLVNSVYGIMGAKSARLYDKDKAQFITQTGQDLNRYIQKLCESKGKKVTYGDSIGGKSEIKVYGKDGSFKYCNIEDLFTKVDFSKGDKEYCNLEDCYVETISNDGRIAMDKVPYIMRHKCDKKVYRVQLTNKWYIDATEDHSIFVYANKAKMVNVRQFMRAITCKTEEIGKKYRSVITRRSSIHTKIEGINKDIRFYEYLGYHVGNGSLNYNKDGKSYYGIISLGSDSDELYPYFIEWLISNNYITNLYKDARGGKHIGDMKYSGLELVKFIEKHIGHSHSKVIPEFMFTETVENIRAFIRGYFTADGTVMMRNDLPIVRLTSINNNLIVGMQKLLYIAGISCGYYIENNSNKYEGKDSGTFSLHLNVYDVPKFRDEIGFITSRKQERLSKANDFKIENGIDWAYSSLQSISEIENFNDYVYDLHCENNHNYFANNILVHNTDSVFISEVHTGNECIEMQNYLNEELAKWSAEKGSKVNFKLKAEKLFRRLLFKPKSSDRNTPGKKKYAGHLIWEEGKDCDEFKFMGLEIKRSDNSNITKTCLEYFLETSIIGGDLPNATGYVRQQYLDVLEGRANILDISMPKEIRKISYDGKNSWIDGRDYAKQQYNYIIQEGEKPRLIYLKHDKVICIDDGFDMELLRNEIDWATMAEKTIKSKLESYFWAVNVEWDEAIRGQTNLDKFF